MSIFQLHNQALQDCADFVGSFVSIADEGLRECMRWQYGVPPVRNAHFAWVQHMIQHLAPTGCAGFVLANCSMSCNRPGEGEIR